MNYLNLEGKPFEDDAMIYDEETHRYTLKINYVKSKLGNTFFGRLGNGDVRLLLGEARDQLYPYIESESRKGNWDVIEYRIAKQNYRGIYQARNDIRDAMVAQLKYARRSGGDMLGDHHGVNLKNGTLIVDWNEIRKKLEVSTSVHRILLGGAEPLIMLPYLRYGVNPDDFRSDY